MRLTTVLIIATIMQVSAAGFAQRVTFSAKQTSLQELFKAIKIQTGYNIVISAERLEKARPIEAYFNNTPLKEVLINSLSNQNLGFTIEQNTIVIKEKSPTFLDRLASRWAAIDVIGRVVDAEGQPMPGASVRVKGTSRVTTTNNNGEFRLTSVDENAILEISFVGYKVRELKVSRDMGSISIEVVTGDLEEINVVSTGYQTLPKERATGSFVHIDNSLINRSVSPDILSRLKGIASGVHFDSTSDNPLGFSVRGRSTILSNTQPLIVLDNFPYDGNLDNINPNDIESIDILKDASAASIWGAFAGNGVIVITTKKGKYNQSLKIDFNSNLTVKNKPDLYYDRQFLNSSDYMDVETELFNRGFYDGKINDIYSLPVLSPVVELLNKAKTGVIPEVVAKTQLDQYRGYDLRNDLEKYFYREAFLQQYSLGINGGSDKLSYILSAGYDRNSQSAVRNNNSRITINSMAVFKPVKGLELTGGINLTNSNSALNSNVNLVSNPGYLYPYAQLADAEGNPAPVSLYFRQSVIDEATQKGLLDWSFSPLAQMRNADNTNQLTDIRLSSGLRYSFTNWISAEVKYQYQKGVSNDRNLFNSNSYTVRNLVNQFSTLTNNVVSQRNVPLGSILDQGTGTLKSNAIRGQLNFDRAWGNHRINAILGSEAREVANTGFNSRLYGYDENVGTSQRVNFKDGFTTQPINGFSYIPNNSGITEKSDRFRSYFANASYSLYDKYIVSGSARIDQSNLFGVNTNQKSVPLWSTGLKWNLSKEDFYKSSLLPQLSLRATYGYNGNINKTLSAYTIAQYLQNSLVPSNSYAWVVFPGDPNLRWEKSGILNIGTDFAFRKIISGSFEFYWKRGTDLIGNSPIAPTSGFNAATGNYADIKGKGFDLTLNSQNITGNLKWETDLLLSYSVDEVTKYKGGMTSAVGVNVVEGKPFHSIFVNDFVKLDESGDPIGLLNGQESKDYSSINNLPSSQQIYYRTQPAYFGSLRNTFSYRGLSASFNLLFKSGYSYLKPSISYGSLFNYGIGNADFSDRWQKAGDENSTNIPAMKYPEDAARDFFYNNSDILVQNGAHVRFQDFNLSYSFSRLSNQSVFKSAQVYLYVNNINWLIYNSGSADIDPDFQSGFRTPVTVSIGIKVGL